MNKDSGNHNPQKGNIDDGYVDKSELGLGLAGPFSSRGEMLFSPGNAFICELLFDAVWFILKLVITTLDDAVRTNLVR